MSREPAFMRLFFNICDHFYFISFIKQAAAIRFDVNITLLLNGEWI